MSYIKELFPADPEGFDQHHPDDNEWSDDDTESYTIYKWEILEENDCPEMKRKWKKNEKRVDQLRLSFVLLVTHTCIPMVELSWDKLQAIFLYVMKAGGMHLICQLSTLTHDAEEDERDRLSSSRTTEAADPKIIAAFKKLFLSRKALLLFFYVTVWFSICDNFETLLQSSKHNVMEQETAIIPFESVLQETPKQVDKYIPNNISATPSINATPDNLQEEYEEEEESEQSLNISNGTIYFQELHLNSSGNVVVLFQRSNESEAPNNYSFEKDADKKNTTQQQIVFINKVEHNLLDLRIPSTHDEEPNVATNVSLSISPPSEYLRKDEGTSKRAKLNSARKYKRIIQPIIHIHKSYHQSIREIHLSKTTCTNRVVFHTKMTQTKNPTNEEASGALMKQERLFSFFTSIIERKQRNTDVLLRKTLERLSRVATSVITTRINEEKNMSMELKSRIRNVWTSPYYEETFLDIN